MSENRDRAGGRSGRKGWILAAVILAGLVVVGGGTHLTMMMHGRVEPPPASEFGLGPRVSSGGLYEATLESAGPLRVRRMHTLKLTVHARGAGAGEGDGASAVDRASIAVDGGMPQHGHGLPTRPRVTRQLGPGTYRVDGVRFNMGGWWELTFRIASAAGTDSVTFNLDL